MPSIQKWVDMLQGAELPVLARTVAEIEILRNDENAATTQRVANVVLHDPFMTVKVLQYLQQHRNRRRSADITTIAHALMMLGLRPFFEHFGEQATIEAKLAGDPEARHGALVVMSRARRTALYAHDWARFRRDVDPEEVMVAALLHDLAEMLLWCFAPELALEIVDRQQHDRALRSEAAQLAILGFRLIDLQLALAKAWQLPELLHSLMNDDRVHTPLVLNVAQAAALARHSARGWDDLALPHDYFVIARLLGVSRLAAEQRVMGVALQAASESEWYGIPIAPPPCEPAPAARA